MQSLTRNHKNLSEINLTHVTCDSHPQISLPRNQDMACHLPERTFIALKPDGVIRGLVGEIITRFEKKGFELVALKLVQPSKTLVEEHYREHSSKYFFPGLLKFLCSGPTVAMVWQGKGVIKTSRAMLGTTDPLISPPGTVRADYAINPARSVIHASDSVESAKREISLWFSESEIHCHNNPIKSWVIEET